MELLWGNPVAFLLISEHLLGDSNLRSTPPVTLAAAHLVQCWQRLHLPSARTRSNSRAFPINTNWHGFLFTNLLVPEKNRTTPASRKEKHWLSDTWKSVWAPWWWCRMLKSNVFPFSHPPPFFLWFWIIWPLISHSFASLSTPNQRGSLALHDYCLCTVL